MLQGIETMALRVERHVENARRVAEFLRSHQQVAWVNYAGFPDSPLYPMAQRYLGDHALFAADVRCERRLRAGCEMFQRAAPF